MKTLVNDDPDKAIEEASESLLALRLLCEARQACGESPTKQINGITIHAPSGGLDQWLTPFSLSSAAKDKIAEVVNLLEEDKQAAATKLFETIKGNDNRKIAKAISDFLKATE